MASCVRVEGEERVGVRLIPVGEECPPSLSRFDPHLQAKLGTFETKMAARNAKRSITTNLRRTGDCE